MIDCFRVATGLYVPQQDPNCELITKKLSYSSFVCGLFVVVRNGVEFILYSDRMPGSVFSNLFHLSLQTR